MPGGPTMPALSNSEGTAASFFAVVANGLRRPMRVTLLLTLMFAFAAVRAFAQGKNPYAGDAKIAKLGEYQFRLNCAFCHGLGARGGGRDGVRRGIGAQPEPPTRARHPRSDEGIPPGV